MPDFYELEKKYKKLQFKKFLKFLVFIIGLFIIIGGVYWYIIQPKKVTKKDIKESKQKTLKFIKPKVIIKEKTKVIVKKVYIEKNITKPKVVTPAPKLNVDFNLDEIQNIKTKPKPKQIKKISIDNKPKHNVLQSNVLKTEVVSFDKAMILAKEYYDNDDNQESLKWCKIASKIDNENEKVWKLYALNLVKLGEKQKAIHILKVYLKYKDSQELKYLLQRLE